MVNTERNEQEVVDMANYNILNIVVNTEQFFDIPDGENHYNILNIVVNTELFNITYTSIAHYNILNIVVNTELGTSLGIN